MMTQPWIECEEKFLIENIDVLPLSEIAKRLKRSMTAVRLKIHRMRLTPRAVVMENPLFGLIKAKFNGHPEYFTPTMDFYRRTGICRNLFWKMYRGEVRASVDICKKVATELGVTGVEFIEALQQTLFDNPDFLPVAENPQQNNYDNRRKNKRSEE